MEESSGIRTEIRHFIIDNFMMGRMPEELTDSDSLLSKGIIDSTGVLELIGFLEENYQLNVDNDDLIPANFDSVNSLVTYIQNKNAKM